MRAAWSPAQATCGTGMARGLQVWEWGSFRTLLLIPGRSSGSETSICWKGGHPSMGHPRVTRDRLGGNANCEGHTSQQLGCSKGRGTTELLQRGGGELCRTQGSLM